MRFVDTPIPKPRNRTSIAGLAQGMLLRVGPVYKLANLVTSVRFVVQGDSMLPSFARDQYILVSRMAYALNEPSRGDVVVLRHPSQSLRTYIKRIIGLPGEYIRIENRVVLINGQPLKEPYLDGGDNHQEPTEGGGPPADGSSMEVHDHGSRAKSTSEWFLDDGQYFVMGDNRAASDDSRSFGSLDRELIVGKAWIRYWPRIAWGKIR